ncbi:MAG: hypothetical protein H8E35_03490 [Ardenticatenia bacterium]|nr:hypothetical protein [Ardenticatenia bacterium]
MKWFLTFSVLTSLLLTACGGAPVPHQDAPARRNITTTQTIQPIKTSTPTPVGTWKTVIDGMIYDRLTGPGKPIVGASISYDVLHSYFAGLQEGRPNKTTSDQIGEFALPVIVHDTDSIRILIEAQGYVSYEERLVGVDLLFGRSFDIGLTPSPTVTLSPP